MKLLKKYDLHIHTYYSRCSNLTPKVILKRAKKLGLNGIAIADHHTIKGALEVKKANKDKHFEVIVGEEIKTEKGEVIAFYLKKEIKPGKFNDVIREIRKQKGIVGIAHPYSTIGIDRRKADIDAIIGKIDAIEGFNARSLFAFENMKAQIKAAEKLLPITAGSDAHFSFEIGRAYTEFEGDLRSALKNMATKVHGSNTFAIPGRLCTLVYKHILGNLRRLFK